MEVRGIPGGITVIDDFGHHPTAIRETLRALRRRYQHERLWAVFEPRSNTTRRNVFQERTGRGLRRRRRRDHGAGGAPGIVQAGGTPQPGQTRCKTSRPPARPPPVCPMPTPSSPISRKRPRRRRDLRFQQRRFRRHPRQTCSPPWAAANSGRGDLKFEICDLRLKI